MRHLLTIVFFLSSALLCKTAFAVSLQPANTYQIPDYLRAEVFVHMSVSEFQKATGHKLGFIQRQYFKKLQKNLSRSQLTSDSTILDHYDVQKGKFKLDWLWFIIGSLIGPFAILFAYTSKQPKNKRLSAFIGLGVFILWFGWAALF